jgi:hypothetical protein
VKRVPKCIDIRSPEIFVRDAYPALLNLINAERVTYPDEAYHFEICGSPGIGKTVFGVWLIGQLVHSRREVGFRLLYMDEMLDLLETRVSRGNWDCKFVDRSNLREAIPACDVGVFDGIPPTRLDTLPRARLKGSFVIASPGVIRGWWKKITFRVTQRFCMPLWESDEFYRWVRESGLAGSLIYPEGRSGPPLFSESPYYVVRVFGFTPPSVLMARRTFQYIGEAFNDREIVKNCFIGDIFNSGAKFTACHRLIVLRPDETMRMDLAVAEPCSKYVAKLMRAKLLKYKLVEKVKEVWKNRRKGGALYGLAFESYCHLVIQTKGRKFKLGAAQLGPGGVRIATHEIEFTTLGEYELTKADWDNETMPFALGKYYIPTAATWPVWDSCGILKVTTTTFLEGNKIFVAELSGPRLVVF